RQRMLQRGDDPVKVEARIQNDKGSFFLTDEMVKMIDVNVDTKKHDLASVSQFIYQKYLEILKQRGIDFEESRND
ncbi:MAG: hypothetical protein MR464_05650, partial [Bacilli bacterium]|nr:hypothetical protein [Bacilli bacterium]